MEHPSSLSELYRPLLEAVAFAARAHRGQIRKDGATPYVSHVFRVCLTLRHVFGIEDNKVLTAAALHDTLEDTTSDFDDLREQFGEDVAGWVAALSKDKRLPESEREEAYCRQLATAPWQVQVCKLADVFDNLLDSGHMPPAKRQRTMNNAQRYLGALGPSLHQQARAPYELTRRLVGELQLKQVET